MDGSKSKGEGENGPKKKVPQQQALFGPQGGKAAVMSPKLRVRREIQELVHMLATFKLLVKPQHVPFLKDSCFIDLKKTKYLEEIQGIWL